MPLLRTYPSLRVWVAGCSSGEEVYSLAILLREEGLLARTLIYATDINAQALEQAEAGVYNVDRIAGFSDNYRKAGGRASLSEYYTAAYGRAVFDKSLRENIVFSDHSLATDSVFAEVQLVSCRNVLIYFDRLLQDRAVGLFRDALVRRGFLGIGAKESLRFSEHCGRVRRGGAQRAHLSEAGRGMNLVRRAARLRSGFARIASTPSSIGASAGGVEALSVLLPALPAALRAGDPDRAAPAAGAGEPAGRDLRREVRAAGARGGGQGAGGAWDGVFRAAGLSSARGHAAPAAAGRGALGRGRLARRSRCRRTMS